MTGKGVGFCVGNYSRENRNRSRIGFGRGFCRGFGGRFGRGWCQQGFTVENSQNIENVTSDEKLLLEKQIKSLKNQLAEMEASLESLGKNRASN
jgi:hypothetical protein